MKNRCLSLILSLLLVFSLVFSMVPLAFPQQKYNEAPMLADLVRQGKLPSVEKRLPSP